MPEKTEMLAQRKISLCRAKNIQYAIKQNHGNRRQQLPAQKSSGPGRSLSQLRITDGGRQDNAIEQIHLVPDQSVFDAQLMNKNKVPAKVIKRVSEARRGEYRRNHSQF